MGSIPLGSAEEVFQLDGGRARRPRRPHPDGETGPRSDWIVWQYPVLSCGPVRGVPAGRRSPPLAAPPARPRRRAADTMRFDDLGYAEAADLLLPRVRPPQARRVDARRLPLPGVHCPTPLAPIARVRGGGGPGRSSSRSTRPSMMGELAAIFEAIPPDQLAIQWDTNFEFAMLDGVMATWFPDARAGIVERLVRLGRSIPAGVQLGYHFCHGHERHHREPALQRPAAGRDRQRPVAQPRPAARLDPPAGGAGSRRRAVLRDAGQLALRPTPSCTWGCCTPPTAWPVPGAASWRPGAS